MSSEDKVAMQVEETRRRVQQNLVICFEAAIEKGTLQPFQVMEIARFLDVPVTPTIVKRHEAYKAAQG